MSDTQIKVASARPWTSVAERDEAYARVTQTFATGKTKSLQWRKWQLKQLWWMFEDNEKAISDALSKDLRRHDLESWFCELRHLKTDTLYHLSHLEELAADEPIKEAGPIYGTLGKARVRKEPLGVVLVIGAWNFPFLLTMLPVVAAIAAGNCVVIKPSELAVASQDLMGDLVAQYLDPEAIRVVKGGPQETSDLLTLKFNHIFFTGSTTVAKYITAAAAKHLTPTVLELGGQGPAIVTANADIEAAAKRVAWAKYLNSGQICLTVNHVFADPAVYDEFIERLVFWSKSFAGNEEGQRCKIVNSRNYQRLKGLLDATDGEVHLASESIEAENLLSSAVVANVTMEDSLLSEELFGPICPVVKATYQEAIKTITSLPHPLALYIFSQEQSEVDHIIQNTISGGVTVNDVIAHHGVPGAPFGGVGDSGMGYYHGTHGFRAFTHLRTIVEPPTWLDKLMAFRYPPFDIRNKQKMLVKNTIGFKRGETMQDQVVGAGKKIKRLLKSGIVASVVAVVLADKFLGFRVIAKAKGWLSSLW